MKFPVTLFKFPGDNIPASPAKETVWCCSSWPQLKQRSVFGKEILNFHMCIHLKNGAVNINRHQTNCMYFN